MVVTRLRLRQRQVSSAMSAVLTVCRSCVCSPTLATSIDSIPCENTECPIVCKREQLMRDAPTLTAISNAVAQYFDT